MLETYDLITAAEILECQQKKILSEWAKGVISVVMDFGDAPGHQRPTAIYSARMFIDATTEADSAEFFNRFTRDDSRDAYFKGNEAREREINNELSQMIVRQYGYSIFTVSGHQRQSSSINADSLGRDVIETTADVFGLWKVSYSDFSRQSVQEYFTLTPAYSDQLGVTALFTPSPHDKSHALNKKNLRIAEPDMETMRDILSGRYGKQKITATPAPHGGIERWALEREKILAAALYVLHHYPDEVGKSFRSHADCIDRYSWIFWDNKPAPDPERVAKILSDATRPPDEWGILGGNAKRPTQHLTQPHEIKTENGKN
ncbi:hypothetical protein [Serratia oryzae]|uniref:hypothetical protein n=1 Tax=Serratia oryzae TaxID=2034155 RepID=UPI0012E1FA78|nr:hypothetical protein [Serratia oryzae]